MAAAGGTPGRGPGWVNPYRRRGLLRRAWPFLAATGVAFVLLPVSATGAIDSADVIVGAALFLAIIAAIVYVPWDRVPRTLTIFPPLV